MKLTKLIKTGIFAGALGLSGCSATNRDWTPGINFGNSFEESQNYNANFFVGRWEDENRNNRLDKEDYFYVPKTFRGDEMISIIADIEGYNGILITRIWNNKTGRIVRAVETEIRGKSLVQYNFTAHEIRENSRGGIGGYTVAWYIENGFDFILMKKQGFEIEKW